ncbi:hypothetical protein [Achromobacter dolens]|uniref:hypothetical protein n=1 Tax=Achromobacter dolens TaxID=1287738 RepID=UPI0012E2669E|nr:hypothetical protein [Achromobacter dolens]
MTPIYSTTLSPAQGLLFLSVLLVFFFFLVVVIPGIKREGEKTGGQLLGQVRVVALFGKGVGHLGGVFYRFSLYEKFLVACLFSARVYEYGEIELQAPYKTGAIRLKLVLGGVPVTLYGNSVDLGVFVEKIRERKSVLLAQRKSNS